MPQLVDLPGHVGRYRVMLGTDEAVLGHWYAFHWRLVGNLGVDVLVAALGPALGVEGATKLVVMLIPPLFLSGTLWISREAHGRVNPFALFAFPLAYSFPFQYGFVNYELGTALGLNAFAAWLMLGRLGRTRLRAALFTPISFILWGAHLMGWGVLGVLVFGAEWAQVRRSGPGRALAAARAASACLPLAGPAVLLILWRSSAAGGQTVGWGRIDLKLSWLAMILRDRWMVFDVASTAVLYLVLYKGLRSGRRHRSPELAAAAALLLTVFAVLPVTVFGSAYADMRLAPLIVTVALLSLRPVESAPTREIRLLAAGGGALAVVRLLGATVSLHWAGQDYARELATAERIPRGSVAVTLIGTKCWEDWAMPRLSHLSGLAMERRSIFTNEQWRLDGSPLLVVHAPALGWFANDPSQLVTERPCRAKGELQTIGRSLAELPRDAVDYVWLIDPPRYDPRLVSGSVVWRSGASVLYRLDRKRPSDRL